MERREVGGGEENGASQSKSQRKRHERRPERRNRNRRRETGTDRNRVRGRNHRMENRLEIVGWKEEEDGEGGRERRSRHKETKGQRKKVTYEAICASR